MRRFKALRGAGICAVLTLVALGVAGAPPALAAAPLYASATGPGAVCSLATPCTLTKALEEVKPDGTIYLVTSGTEGTPATYYSGHFTIGTSGTSASEPVTIAPYETATPPILDGGENGTVLTVGSSVYVNVSGVTIQKGKGGGSGGGIHNTGTLTVNDSTVSDNQAGNEGAGIDNTGTLTVNDSTVSGNTAFGYGGGIENSGTLTVTNSTLSGNSGSGGKEYGGGGIHTGGTATVTDSTLSGNSSGNAGGGGIINIGTLTVTDSTLSGNTAPPGEGGAGGIRNAGGATMRLGASILADNTAGNCSGNGATADEGYNIADDSTCKFSATSSTPSSPTLDASLGALANNGGPTETILPAPGSPAVGVIPLNTTLNGVQVCPRTDQRGVASGGGNCTIGAVEVPVGPRGATGATGATGPTGAAGSNGTNGAAGSNGANGVTGGTGAAGSNGTNGSNGAEGAAGSNGANGSAG